MYNYNLDRVTYIVKKGDTLYGVSKQFGITVNDLIKYNKLTLDCIQEGQILDVGPFNTSNRVNHNYIVYTVNLGDSIYSIARKYGTTVDAIMKLNGLNTNLLSIGQKIKIPTAPGTKEPMVKSAFMDYVVEQGDSLYSIARKYNLTVNEIMKDNNLGSPVLEIGQVLKIKLGEKTYDIIGCYGQNGPEADGNYANYIVKPGDSLFAIARNYNMTVNELMALNNLTGPNIYVGQILKIREF